MKKHQLNIESLGHLDGEYILTKDITKKLKVGDKLGLFKTEVYQVVCLNPIVANNIKKHKVDKVTHLKLDGFKMYKRDGKYAI